METKKCKKCGEIKPKTNEFFTIQKKYSPKGTIYYESKCKKCNALIAEEKRKKGLHLESRKKYQSSQKYITYKNNQQKQVNIKYNNKLGGGVYGIFCDKGECLYIGSSSQIQMRFNKHNYNIKNPLNAEKNDKTMAYLYPLLRQYNTLLFEIIDICEENIQFKLESFYKKIYQPKYNRI